MGVSAAITYDSDSSLTWVADDWMERASHALADDGRVWLIDPVRHAPALARARELGEPAAVLQLLDRHPRDCAAVAEELGVPLLRLPDRLPDTPFTPMPLVQRSRWREHGLWWDDRRLLVVPEAVGTAPYFALGDGPVGVHPLLRIAPPPILRTFLPDHLLVGHGPSVHEDAGDALQAALRGSLRELPTALLRLPGRLLGG